MNTNTLTFAKVYTDYHKTVYLNSLKILKNSELAEENTSDVFLKVNEHMQVFNIEISQLNTWLFNITKNNAIDIIRSKGYKNSKCNISIDVETTDESRVYVYEPTDSIQADNTIIRKQLSASLKTAFATLKPKYLEVANLYYIEQKSMQEVCEILNIPTGTFKGMLSRCRESLQSHLKTEYASL